MGEPCLAGIDIGTQGTKAALYTVDGRLLAEAFQASVLLRSGQGTVEEDPELQLGSVCATIRSCLEKCGANPSDVLCVAIDGQMAGVIGVGADGLALTPYDSWLDTRCASQVERMKSRAGSEILEKTGNAPSFNHGPKILWWKETYPETYEAVRSFVQPGGYAAMRLCGLSGGQAFIDGTYLHFSGFADNAKEVWDPGLCREFGIDPARLPRIAKPAEIIGRLTGEMAARCGLKEGTPVAAGCGDTAASFLSCGATGKGICVDVAGTASVFASTTDRFVPDTKSGIMGVGRSAVPGLWHPYAYINGGGMNVLWFAGRIAPGILSAGNPSSGTPAAEVTYEDLDHLVKDLLPLEDDPFFVPHMEGRVAPNDSGIRGAWAGIKRSHGLDRLYRSVLESVAFEYALYLDAIRKMQKDLVITEMRITGGGANSGAWNSIKSDVLALPVRSVTGSGGAPMGAAMLAASAAGVTEGPAEIAGKWLSFRTIAEPDHVHDSLNAARLAKYRYLLEALSGFPAGVNA